MGVEAEGRWLTVTFTLPPDVGGGNSASGDPTNTGQNSSLTEVLPRVVRSGGGGSLTDPSEDEDEEP